MTTSRKPKKVLIQFTIALIVAVVLGAVAIFAGFSLINSISNRAEQSKKEAEKKSALLQIELDRIKSGRLEQPQQQRFKVVTALVDIEPGKPIGPSMVEVNEVDSRPPAGTLERLSQAFGKTARNMIPQGEPLTLSELADSSISQNIPPGHRAITLRLDASSGVSGTILPGTKVDILTTIIRQEKAYTRTVLQNIPVLAAGTGSTGASSPSGVPVPSSGATANNSGFTPVTLLVTPKEAETLTLAAQVGTFHFTLRNAQDDNTSHSSGADLGSLIVGAGANSTATPPSGASPGERAPDYPPNASLPAPSDNRKSSFSMKIYRGSGTETIEFQQ